MIRHRIAALLAAVVLFAAAWEAAHLAGGPWRTTLTAAAFCTVLGLGFTACALALLPNRNWRTIHQVATQWQRQLRDAEIPADALVSWTLLAIGAITFAMLVRTYVRDQAPPEGNDQAEYVKLAQQIDQRGGPIGCLRDLYTGQFAEANRHPLYPMLLSYFPKYESGKWLSAAWGAVTLAALTTFAWRHFGGIVAGVFCVLLATNAAFLTVSSLVACETLVVLFSGMIWFLSLVEAPLSRGRTMVSGMLYGLLYLTKAHAVVLLAGTVIWRIMRDRFQAFRAKQIIGWGLPFLIAVIVIASPLLVRNARRYGNPLFNVNGHLMFMDQFVDPVELSNQKSASQVAAEYLRSHTLTQMVSREVKGLVWEAFIMVRALGSAPWDDARVGFGSLVLAACLIAVFTDPRAQGASRLGGHLLVWTVLLWLLFAWYVPIAAGERFILPLLAPALVLAAIGFVRLFVSICDRSAGGTNRVRWLIPLAAVWCIVTILLTNFLVPFEG